MPIINKPTLCSSNNNNNNNNHASKNVVRPPTPSRSDSKSPINRTSSATTTRQRSASRDVSASRGAAKPAAGSPPHNSLITSRPGFPGKDAMLSQRCEATNLPPKSSLSPTSPSKSANSPPKTANSPTSPSKSAVSPPKTANSPTSPSKSALSPPKPANSRPKSSVSPPKSSVSPSKTPVSPPKSANSPPKSAVSPPKSAKSPTSPPKSASSVKLSAAKPADTKKPIIEKSVVTETKQPNSNTKVTVEKCTVTTKTDDGKTTVVTETTKKTEVVEMAKVEPALPTPKDYPDSDEEIEGESPKRKSSSLQYGTISNWQADNLELLYARANKFPNADDVNEFSEKYNIQLIDIEIWLETRRELTYKKYCEQGRDTEPSVMQFYSEAMKMAEGIRLEQPAIRSKSFFSLNGINEIEAKKEQEDKEVPSLQLSTNKLYLVPNREDKSQLILKNIGEVNIVYQVFVSNSDLYVMSPTCAILQPDEELTLNIVRKPGAIGEHEFFRVDYGRNPDGFIDARESADRAEMDMREIVEIVDLDDQDMKVAR